MALNERHGGCVHKDCIGVCFVRRVPSKLDDKTISLNTKKPRPPKKYHSKAVIAKPPRTLKKKRATSNLRQRKKLKRKHDTSDEEPVEEDG